MHTTSDIVQVINWQDTEGVGAPTAVRLQIVTSTASAGGKLICHIVPSIPEGEVKVDWSSNQVDTIMLSDPHICLKYPWKVLFAFRVQCFHFNAESEYIDMEVDAGVVRPKVW